MKNITRLKKIIVLIIIFSVFGFFNIIHVVAAIDQATLKALNISKDYYLNRVSAKKEVVQTRINTIIPSLEYLSVSAQDHEIASHEYYEINYLDDLINQINQSTTDNELIDLMNTYNYERPYLILSKAMFFYKDSNRMLKNVQTAYELINNTYSYINQHTELDDYTGSIIDNIPQIQPAYNNKWFSFINQANAAKKKPGPSVTPPSIPVCGNGRIETGELCDGNSMSCTINGYSGTAQCSSTCDSFDACQTTESCGDGIVNGTEECDEGSSSNGSVGGFCKIDCTIRYLDEGDVTLLDQAIIDLYTSQTSLDLVTSDMDSLLINVYGVDIDETQSLVLMKQYNEELEILLTLLNTEINNIISSSEDIMDL